MLADLRQRVLADLEAVAEWQTERRQRPVLILGQLDGVLTGIRQLRRAEPLETEEIDGLCVPTLAEMVRIKAWLLATRHLSVTISTPSCSSSASARLVCASAEPAP